MTHIEISCGQMPSEMPTQIPQHSHMYLSHTSYISQHYVPLKLPNSVANVIKNQTHNNDADENATLSLVVAV